MNKTRLPLSDEYRKLCRGELADPYPEYRRLRDSDPVHWSEGFNGWLVTRYVDVHAALKDSRLPSGGRLDSYMGSLPSAALKELQPLRNHYATWLVNLDPPDHTRLRTLVSKAFTPRMVDHLRTFIKSAADELLSSWSPGDGIDFVSRFARPLPARVIAKLLGIKPEESAQFERWSEEISAFQGTGKPQVALAERAQAAVEAMSEFVRQLLDRRRAKPIGDLLGELVSVEERGERLQEHELVGMAVFLLVAGHETTMSLLANGLLALVRNPDQFDRLRAEPDLMPSAIEEFLRFDSPLQHQVRAARDDMVIANVPIGREDRVVIMLGAANRDPAQFPDPDRLDVGRSPNQHLAFGLGTHYCLGAPLARLEGQIAFQSLLEQFSEIRLCESNIVWRRHTSMRNPEQLQVEVCRDRN